MEFWDTNELLKNYSRLSSSVYISSVSIQELEHIKTSRNKDEAIKYAARKTIHAIEEREPKVLLFDYYKGIKEISDRGLEDTPDNRIIATAYMYVPDALFVTNDLCCRLIAEDIFGLRVLHGRVIEESIYKGYQEITGDTEYINTQLPLLDIRTNEYVIINNTDDGSTKEMRFDGTKFVSLKLPHSRYVKGKNSLQRCALDILNNPDITIAAILGGYGSGKSFLTSKMALYSVLEKGWQSKVLGVREVVGEGREIGYLPGEKEAKIGDFFLPLAQQLDGGEFELEKLKQRGVLEVNVPYFMKGTTYNETVMLVDEAEDLTEKQIRLIGTRLGTESRIFLNGDYKQSVINSSDTNGLIKLCNTLKGNPRFGCIYLGEDVRSETSKLFADLFYD